MDVDDSSDDDEMEEESEQERQQQPVRKSSRSTAFRGEMKDPTHSIADLLKIVDEADDNASKATKRRGGKSREDESGDDEKQPPKSPAKRRVQKRRKAPPPEESSEEESSEDESSEEEEEAAELKFSKIIASKSLTLAEWKEVSAKTNTTEITDGSRWIQDRDTSEENPDKYEERFLVKWNDLSHLHCSWETERDLLEFCEGAKGRMSTFFKKSSFGLLYDADERLDGVSVAVVVDENLARNSSCSHRVISFEKDYFDPSWVTVERILECNVDIPTNEQESDPVKRYGIILDPKHPKFEEGTGRQFHVKWMNKNYSETSYEFERDLILNEVEYTEHLAAYENRKDKPTRAAVKGCEDIGKAEMKRLLKVFSDKVKTTEEERESLIKAYQLELEEKEFKCGGKLRDYQAEGVTWLMSNHINQRSSILADEMGLGCVHFVFDGRLLF